MRDLHRAAALLRAAVPGGIEMAISRFTRSLVVFGAVALFGGCAAVPDEDVDLPSDELPQGEISAEGYSLNAIFEDAADEFGVPVELLKAIAWAETGWQPVHGHAEFEDQEPAYGVMALRGTALEYGSQLAGVSVDDAMNNTEANVRAGAAMLDAWGTELDIDRAELGAWAQPAVNYSGIAGTMGQSSYVHNEVYKVLREGLSTEGAQIEAHDDVVPQFPALAAAGSPGPDYSAAIWRPSPNWSYRPSGTSGDPQMVIIHTCEGSYSGCWSWLANSASGVSAHYVVNSSGSEVSQLVKESRKAWHISAKYACSRNSNNKCNLNNVSSNNFTVGIEHAGYANQSSWSTGLLNTSAKLTCDITKDNGIPADKYHIVGHGQLQPWNRVDPGPNWPWSSYINKVNGYCNNIEPEPEPEPEPNPTPGAFSVVVDSNPNANGTSAKLEVGNSWTGSANVSGYYNTGYWWRTTGQSSDLAKFKAYVPQAMTVRVQAWWPAASDRTTKAPWLIYNAEGAQLDTVFVNQKQNGGKWVTLGEYPMTKGWNTVALSRWSSASGVVVADAVKFTQVN